MPASDSTVRLGQDRINGARVVLRFFSLDNLMCVTYYASSDAWSSKFFKVFQIVTNF